MDGGQADWWAGWMEGRLNGGQAGWSVGLNVGQVGWRAG